MFLSLSKMIEPRKLLILDEAHELPSEILKFQSYSITKNKWQKYLGQSFQISNLGYEDIIGWLDFLIGLKENMLKGIRVDVTTTSNIAEIERKLVRFQIEQPRNQLVIDKLQEMLQPLNEKVQSRFKNLTVEMREDVTKLNSAINTMSSEPFNYIISDMKFDAIHKDVVKVEFKPLDVSKRCRRIFEKGEKVLMMSATILDPNAFCREVGLDLAEVKMIKVGSTFPIENRKIYPLDIVQMNKNTLCLEEVKQAIVRTVDKIMTHHKTQKGIIHLTSYDQLNYIFLNISSENKHRLIKTDPEIGTKLFKNTLRVQNQLY
jgi:ATP-dependent DNA helicase DinG